MLNVYAALWCPHCVKTISYLEEKGIEFKYHDMEKQTGDILEKIIRVNGGDDWVVPTLEYNGKWRKGESFNAESLQKDLESMGVTGSLITEK